MIDLDLETGLAALAHDTPANASGAVTLPVAAIDATRCLAKARRGVSLHVR